MDSSHLPIQQFHRGTVHLLMCLLTHSLTLSVCRVSHYAKVRFSTHTDREDLYVAAIQHVLRVVTDAGDIIRLAVCKLIPAKYGHCEDILTVKLASSMQQVLAMDIAELDTKLVTAVDNNRLFGLVYTNSSGMG